MTEIILILATVLLLPVFYFSSKWGFETLHQHYMAKVALTEFEKRTRAAEDAADSATKRLTALMNHYEPLVVKMEAIEKANASLDGELKSLKNIAGLIRNTVPGTTNVRRP
jgi:hypothetical protein